MKKLFITLSLILIIAPVFSQSFLDEIKIKPAGAIDYFAGDYKIYSFSDTFDLGNMRGRMKLTANWKFINLYAESHVYMSKSDGLYFTPRRVDWFTGISVNVNKNIKVSYEHLCIHPVISHRQWVDMMLMGGYDKFTLSYGY